VRAGRCCALSLVVLPTLIRSKAGSLDGVRARGLRRGGGAPCDQSSPISWTSATVALVMVAAATAREDGGMREGTETAFDGKTLIVRIRCGSSAAAAPCVSLPPTAARSCLAYQPPDGRHGEGAGMPAPLAADAGEGRVRNAGRAGFRQAPQQRDLLAPSTRRQPRAMGRASKRQDHQPKRGRYGQAADEDCPSLQGRSLRPPRHEP
jgi:hypothetical protein